MTAADDTFGLQVYDVVCALGRRDVLTARMDYAGIQALKGASRAEAEEQFRGSGPLVMKLLATGTPGEFATYLCGVADGRAAANGNLLFLGVLLWA